MGVSQKDIAEYLRIDRTTVTKILNRDPRYSASEETKERVFRAAEELGYDFTTIRRPFKREYGRVMINLPCDMEIFLEDGTIFDSGRALVKNLGVGGALLTRLRTEKMVLPIARFRLKLRLPAAPDLVDLSGECELVRLSEADNSDEPELGVRFINASHRDRRILRGFVDKRLAEEKARFGPAKIRSEAGNAGAASTSDGE